MNRFVLITLLVAGSGVVAAIGFEVLYQWNLGNVINQYGATHVIPPNQGGGLFCAYAFRDRSGPSTIGNQWLLAGPAIALWLFGIACLILGLVARSRRREGAGLAIAVGVVEMVFGLGALIANEIWVSAMMLNCMD